MKTKLSDLEKQADPNWMPQIGDVYYWRECATRRGAILWATVLSLDSQRQIVRGRRENGMTERKYLSDIFHVRQEFPKYD